jgi:phosphotriesterase-related protein
VDGLTNTVHGPKPTAALGIVLPHEHVLCSFSNWQMPAQRESVRAVADDPIDLRNLSLVRRHPHSFRDNLVFSDIDQQARELRRFAAAGGRTVVDLTLETIGRNPVGCAEIARAAGVNIICGTGLYVQSAHPTIVATQSVDELAQIMVEELTVGIGDTGVKAGVIGEIGTSAPIHPDEEKALRAAARAHHATGAPIWVHLDGFAQLGHEVLDVLIGEGVEPQRVALCHLDAHLPDHVDYHMSLADRGAFIEYDLWGNEWTNDDRREVERAVRFIPPLPSDMERARALKTLVDGGYAGSLLVSHDVSVKIHLTEYGGFGYAHFLENIVPLLRDLGAQQHDLTTIIETNPQRLLGWGTSHA